jgi:hypothetical protein
VIKYRIFSEDVGPGKFSAVEEVTAPNPREAILPFCTDKKRRLWYGQRVIALPDNRRDLWPDSKTGTVPSEALKYR